MLLVPVESSDIFAVGYDPQTSEMQIQFQTGTIYSYQLVSPEIYQAFLDAPSKGSFIAQNFRKQPGLYPAQRIM